MDENLSQVTSYTTLHENGLKLPENDFSSITEAITKGIAAAKIYLQVVNEPHPKLVFSDTVGVIGYSLELDAINIRMDYLNLVASNTTPLIYRDQLVCFVPDTFYMILKHLNWMWFFGVEETIHYYQRHGNPMLQVAFPDKLPEMLSPKSLLLSDLEIEARKIVDKIATVNNENPIWKNVDGYLSANYPEYYNKPLSELSTLPKPDLPISFEMENLLI